MSLLIWLGIGLVAGIAAKAISPQKESSGWVSSIGIGIVGSIIGGFIADFTGLDRILGDGIIGSLIIAVGGAVLVLYLYYRYFADKWKLPL